MLEKRRVDALQASDHETQVARENVATTKQSSKFPGRGRCSEDTVSDGRLEVYPRTVDRGEAGCTTLSILLRRRRHVDPETVSTRNVSVASPATEAP